MTGQQHSIDYCLVSDEHPSLHFIFEHWRTVPVCSTITWEKVFQGCRILFVPRPRDCPGVPPSWNWFRVGISQCSKMLTVLTVLTEPWVCCSAHRCSRGHPPTLSLTAWIGHSAVRQQRWDRIDGSPPRRGHQGRATVGLSGRHCIETIITITCTVPKWKRDSKFQKGIHFWAKGGPWLGEKGPKGDPKELLYFRIRKNKILVIFNHYHWSTLNAGCSSPFITTFFSLEIKKKKRGP